MITRKTIIKYFSSLPLSIFVISYTYLFSRSNWPKYHNQITPDQFKKILLVAARKIQDEVLKDIYNDLDPLGKYSCLHSNLHFP
jgi:hypothetical protein